MVKFINEWSNIAGIKLWKLIVTWINIILDMNLITNDESKPCTIAKKSDVKKIATSSPCFFNILKITPRKAISSNIGAIRQPRMSWMISNFIFNELLLTIANSLETGNW